MAITYAQQKDLHQNKCISNRTQHSHIIGKNYTKTHETQSFRRLISFSSFKITIDNTKLHLYNLHKALVQAQLGGGCKAKSTPKTLSRLSVQMEMAIRRREVYRGITSSNQKGKEIAQEEDTMEIGMSGATLTKRNQGDQSSNKNIERVRSMLRDIAPIPTAFWLGFVALEKLYIGRGALVAPTSIIAWSLADKVKGGMT